jgi:hypothetical protein
MIRDRAGNCAVPALRRGTGPKTDITVAAHALFKQNGFAVTLLAFESDEDEDSA